MSQEQAVAERNVIDASSIIMHTGVEIPPIVRESKYPWGQLVVESTTSPESMPSFSVPIGSYDDARTSRTSIHASGKNYLDNRGLPLKVITRVLSLDGGVSYSVMSWVVPQTLEVEEEEEAQA